MDIYSTRCICKANSIVDDPTHPSHTLFTLLPSGKSAFHDGEWGECKGVPPEIHYNLHCFERAELQVVKTTPDSQLLNLLSVSRLITILDEADNCSVIHKLQELDRWISRGAVIGVNREEQWGEDATSKDVGNRSGNDAGDRSGNDAGNRSGTDTGTDQNRRLICLDCMMDSNSSEPGQYLPRGNLGPPVYSQSSPWPLLQSMADTNTSFLQGILNFSAVSAVNRSDGGSESKYDPLGGHSLWQVILIVLFTGFLSLITIIGNILVIVSFKVNRQLKTVNNYFLLSLAFADLIIGVISMNLYTTYIVMGQWAMGNWACDFWLAIDYVASNASVMNLLVISFDRYFSITRPLTYRARRTTKRAGLMIGLAWLVSLILWAPAILFWQYFVGERTVPPDKCYIQFLSEPIITFCTAMAAFYFPVTIMSVLYWRIYKETENRSRELAGLQGSGGPLMGADRPHFHIAATRGSSRSCRSFELSRSTQRQKSLLGLSGHCWRWRSGAAAGIHKGAEVDQSSCDSWNNNDTADHSGSSDDEESAPSTARAIFSIVLSLPGMRAAVNSQIKPSEDLVASEEDPLQGTAGSNSKNDSLSCSVSNGKKRLATNVANMQSVSGIQATPTSIDTTDATTDKSASTPISFKEAALAKRFVSRARTQITKRKRMSLVKEKKAAQTLSAILFAFIITWTPYNIMVLINTFCNGCIPESLWALGYWLCYVNSTVNPMCYALCNKTFRTTFKMILLCRWNEKKSKQSFQQRESVRLHRSIPGDST
ncbi:hypothetical protein QTP86_005316 [Hemibagrus guttatus]|nr:hypothetical protein QTP86_005316 [Hemibagrus guttatus]